MIGPIPHTHPQAEGQDPARQGGLWDRTQGRRLQPGAGRNDTEISGPAQVPAQSGFQGRSSHWQGCPRLVGWLLAQQAQKTDLSTYPCRHAPKDDQIIEGRNSPILQPQCQCFPSTCGPGHQGPHYISRPSDPLLCTPGPENLE